MYKCSVCVGVGCMPLYINLSSTEANCVTKENKKNKGINKGMSIDDSAARRLEQKANKRLLKKGLTYKKFPNNSTKT